MADQSVIISALHPVRMAPYLAETGGNRKKALALYRWHLELTAAVQTVLGVTEVILRNSIDQQLQAWNTQQDPGKTSWLLYEPASPLRSLTQGKRVQALQRAQNVQQSRPPQHPRHNQPVTHDDVLAQIMFGMWKDILPNHMPNANPNNQDNINRLTLWNDAISKAFPHISDPDGSITFWRVAHLHQLRNRVSHMEPLLTIDVQDIITNDAFALLASINPVIREWASGSNRVPLLLKQRPV